MTLEKINKFQYGFITGLILPALFIWLYLNRFYPRDIPVTEIIRELYPGILLGKLLLLSAIPNLLLVYVFYKQDSFKFATGLITAAMPYLIPGFFML